MNKPKSTTRHTIASDRIHTYTSNGQERTDKNILSKDSEDVEDLILKIKILERQLETRKSTYFSKEQEYRERIAQLEKELQGHGADERAGFDGLRAIEKINKCKELQHQIIECVETAQERAERLLIEQEQGIVKAFQARLFNIQAEFQQERSRNDDGATLWIDKCRKLESEFEWAQDTSRKLELEKQQLQKEVARLKQAEAAHAEDRQFLVRQVVAAKKENEAMQAELSAAKQQLDKALNDVIDSDEDDDRNGPSTPLTRTVPALSPEQSEERCGKYKRQCHQLRRALVREKEALCTVRENYAAELHTRTELELLLRACVEDAKREAAMAREPTGQGQGLVPRPSSQSGSGPRLSILSPGVAASMTQTVGASLSPSGKRTGRANSFKGRQGHGLPCGLDAAGRAKAIQSLLGQYRVMQLLYEKTFDRSGSDKAPDADADSDAYEGVPRLDVEEAVSAQSLDGDNGLVESKV